MSKAQLIAILLAPLAAVGVGFAVTYLDTFADSFPQDRSSTTRLAAPSGGNDPSPSVVSGRRPFLDVQPGLESAPNPSVEMVSTNHGGLYQTPDADTFVALPLVGTIASALVAMCENANTVDSELGSTRTLTSVTAASAGHGILNTDQFASQSLASAKPR